jgi:hypothetical protein
MIAAVTTMLNPAPRPYLLRNPPGDGYLHADEGRAEAGAPTATGTCQEAWFQRKSDQRAIAATAPMPITHLHRPGGTNAPMANSTISEPVPIAHGAPISLAPKPACQWMLLNA